MTWRETRSDLAGPFLVQPLPVRPIVFRRCAFAVSESIGPRGYVPAFRLAQFGVLDDAEPVGGSHDGVGRRRRGAPLGRTACANVTRALRRQKQRIGSGSGRPS